MRGRHDESTNTPGGADPPGVFVSGPPHPGITYRPEIDGLRAIAVLAVAVFHAEAAWLPGGFAGVDVFFVLSGYLITSLLAAEWRTRGRIDFPGFYARRARRLLPALALVLVVVTLASAVLLGPMGSPFQSFVDSAMASALFVANEYFLATSGGYFAGPDDQLPLLHLWSLAVEEQFYLVYPLLLALLLRRGRRWALVVLALLSLLSIWQAEAWLASEPARAFFRTTARFWELAAGALVALSALRPRRPALWAAAGMALVLAALVASGESGHFPGLGALPAVLGTALLLAAGQADGGMGAVGRLLSARPLVVVGLWSYSLYLWHWPLLALDEALRFAPSPPAWRVLLCLLAVLLAAATYRFVEQPVRRRLRLPDRRTLLVAGLASTVLLALAYGLGRWPMVPSERAGLVAQARADHPTDMGLCHYGLGAPVASPVPPGCPVPARPARVAAWGDSHALAWRPFAETLARQAGQSVLPMTMDACPPWEGSLPAQPDSPRHAARCEQRNRLALADLGVPGRFDRVVLAARWAGHADSPAAIAGLRTRLADTLAQLGAVPSVLVLAPTPELPAPAPDCIASGRIEACVESREDFEQRAAPVRAMFRELATRFPNLTIVDPVDFFCDETRCPAMRDGLVLYWDDDHVSASAAAAFGRAYLGDPARYTLPAERTGSPGR